MVGGAWAYNPAMSDTSSAEHLLGELIEAWGSYPNEDLSQAIIKVGQSIPRPPLKASSRAKVEEAWLEVAAKRDVCDVDRLLASPWPGAWKAALARVTALSDFPNDPRIARALVHKSHTYKARASEPLHLAIAELLARIREHETRHELRKILGIQKGTVRASYERALTKVTSLRPEAPPPELVAKIKKLLDTPAPTLTPVDLEALWSEVWSDPQDLGKRLVLADALTQVDDPRGEFISLQCMEDPPRKSITRAKKILKAHIDDFTGPLPVVRASRVFERGFLTRARVNAESKHFHASLNAKEWRTLEEIGIDVTISGSPIDVGVLKVLERMPSARALYTYFSHGCGDVSRLASADPFPSVRVFGVVREVITKPLPSLPNLEVLAGEWLQFASYTRPEITEADCRAVLAQIPNLKLRALIVRGVIRTTFFQDHWQTFWKTYLDVKPTGTVCLEMIPSPKSELRAPGWRFHLTPGRVTMGWYGKGKWDPKEPPAILPRFEGVKEKLVYVPVRGKTGAAALETLTASLPSDVKVVPEALALVLP